MGTYTIHHGNVIDILPTLTPNSYHACLCDPPYGISFMGQDWDHEIAFQKATWEAISRVLKPGAPVMAFGGTRTYHRLACAIEDGGFEIRDSLCWLYASGFPKSLNVSKEIDKRAGAKRKVIGHRTLGGNAALSTKEKGGTYASNTKSKGTTIQVEITEPATPSAKDWNGYGTNLKPAWEPITLARKPLKGTITTNCLTHGCGALTSTAHE